MGSNLSDDIRDDLICLLQCCLLCQRDLIPSRKSHRMVVD